MIWGDRQRFILGIKELCLTLKNDTTEKNQIKNITIEVLLNRMHNDRRIS
jgi:hypothetical protein